MSANGKEGGTVPSRSEPRTTEVRVGSGPVGPRGVNDEFVLFFAGLNHRSRWYVMCRTGETRR